jgi:hypothetical protein
MSDGEIMVVEEKRPSFAGVALVVDLVYGFSKDSNDAVQTFAECGV